MKVIKNIIISKSPMKEGKLGEKGEKKRKDRKRGWERDREERRSGKVLELLYSSLK